MKDSKQTEALKELLPDNVVRSILKDFMDSLPYITVLLDHDRRLIYSNDALVKSIPDLAKRECFNLLPGELFGCVYSDKNETGCGTTEACRFCGANLTLLESIETGKRISNECKILANGQKGVTAYNFKITSAPFKWNGSSFLIVTIEDISTLKRKAELERVFFHDLMNSIGNIEGILSLMKKKGTTDPFHLRILESVYHSLHDTVNEQKQFSQAERGELLIEKNELNSLELLEEVVLHFSIEDRYKSKLVIDKETVNRFFYSDQKLLMRILINMVKNAFEASSEKDSITIGANAVNGYLRFWTHNPAVISEKNQYMIFERAFSTKGPGRGIGTFSMKLLGENYLGGSVDFISEKEKGTTFWIDLPLNH